MPWKGLKRCSQSLGEAVGSQGFGKAVGLKAVAALEGIETTTDGEHWSDMIPSQSSSCLLQRFPR